MFSFHFFTSVILVVLILSSSQIALNGLQNKEWIERVLFLLKTKRRGGLCRRNIRPVNFFSIVSQIFAFVVFFLPSME